MANKSAVLVAAENCTGCLLCSLACSFFTTPERVFSLSKSKIEITRGRADKRFELSLSDDCTGCGICVDYCKYDALSMA